MSQQYPQVFEPHLDEIMSGGQANREVLRAWLRKLLVVRRRYNDPYQNGDKEGPSFTSLTSTMAGRIGGEPFSNRWSVSSQKDRIEAGIAYLLPIVGAEVGDYPPIASQGEYGKFDSMGHFIPLGKP